MAYKRGFKKQAHAVASEVRAELELGPLDLLDPFALASHLAVPVIPLSVLSSEVPQAVAHFLHGTPESFSAVTVFRGLRRIIVYNDAHVLGRQHSDVAHELSHALLLHEPQAAFGEGGCRNWNADHEDEANFLAAALLVSEEAALDVVRRGIGLRQAAAAYGVTPKLMQWRINATGARKRVERSRRFQRSPGRQTDSSRR